MEAVIERPHLLCPVVHPEDVGAARRRMSRAAFDAGVGSPMLAAAELAVTELGNNLIRHAAPGGFLLVRTVDTARGAGVEVVSVDRGPGIADVDAALGGRSAAPAGLGCGLAAVRRVAATFDIYSRPGVGTVVMARLLPVGATVESRWSGVSVSIDGGDDCGDAWAVVQDAGRTTALAVDGLGHGPGAAEAARAAVTAFAQHSNEDLEQLAQRIHVAMRTTRGGAAALCRLDPARGAAEFVGVGNVAGRLLAPGSSQAMVSMNGTLGTEIAPPRIRRMTYECDGAALVLCTDGVRDHFDLDGHPGLLDHDPLLVAATIHGACGRGTDDATVVVVRPTAAEVTA